MISKAADKSNNTRSTKRPESPAVKMSLKHEDGPTAYNVKAESQTEMDVEHHDHKDKRKFG